MLKVGEPLELPSVGLSLGVAPHCLDPGTVCSVTVEKFGGDKWEESMQAHKNIKDMSKCAADAQVCDSE